MEKYKYYRIYAKTKKMKRFGALDVQGGCIVSNLMYATFWDDSSEAEKVCNSLKEKFPEINFEVRKV